MIAISTHRSILLLVYGPDKEFVESWEVPAAFRINLRRELQSRDFKLYDAGMVSYDTLVMKRVSFYANLVQHLFMDIKRIL